MMGMMMDVDDDDDHDDDDGDDDDDDVDDDDDDDDALNSWSFYVFTLEPTVSLGLLIVLQRSRRKTGIPCEEASKISKAMCNV